ncbi:hypothetical protein QKW60_08115 [Defluviimonas aestuarii]|uniref:hypothetical protein n=1 Tax=Albidovulum aestuarii TaxID=1130726 RepID=UPI00249A996B|nr:hypothetical protein [Defluviimonas aestuarii]MDI3336367.1 hypothetical protein [Defluviimonas aestuarii]
MRTIDPELFARLMRLPDTARTDLLEFLGATPLADVQLSAVIDAAAAQMQSTSRSVHIATGRIDDII